MAFVSPALAEEAKAPEARRPNVLFIAVDDLNDWVGVLGGHPQARTPHIDRLASRGVLFENAHAPATVCTPSRTAVLTGIRPSTSGIYDNRANMRDSPALRDAVTLPGWFRKHGYRAIGSGKMFGIGKSDPASWDEYVPSKERETHAFLTETPANHNGLDLGVIDWADVPIEQVHQISDTRSIDWVVEQLGRDHEQPVFLAAGIFRPHPPWYVPREFRARLDVDGVSLPPGPADDLDDIAPDIRDAIRADGYHERIVEAGAWKAGVHAYLAAVAYADQQIGRLVRALDRGPLADDTIVVLWSDHGFHLGEKQRWRKRTLWERVTRVPLIIVAPGVTKAGSRTRAAVGLIDLYPTLLDVAGLPPNPDVEGQSLRPLLEDPTLAWPHLALTTHSPGNHTLRGERFRLIQYAQGSLELYDHKLDPHEWRNVVSDRQYRDVVIEMQRRMPTQDAERR